MCVVRIKVGRELCRDHSDGKKKSGKTDYTLSLILFCIWAGIFIYFDQKRGQLITADETTNRFSSP